MIDPALLSDLPSFHVGILIPAIAAYYRYGSRSEWPAKPLAGVDGTVRNVRSRIANDLSATITPVLRSAGTTPTPVADPSLDKVERTGEFEAGWTYVERPVDALASEAYKEALRRFVDATSDSVADYRTILEGRRAWYSAARLLGWGVLLLLVWELAAAFITYLGPRLLSFVVPLSLIRWSFLPTAGLLVVTISSLIALHVYQERIQKVKDRYDEV